MRDNRHKIYAASQVDRFFNSYEIDMTPEEALSFVAMTVSPTGIPEALYDLIDVINQAVPPIDFGPNHPKTGTSHHHFKVGRERGHRIIVLEIFKGYVAAEYSIEGLTDTLIALAAKAKSTLDQVSDENGYRFTFKWPA